MRTKVTGMMLISILVIPCEATEIQGEVKPVVDEVISSKKHPSDQNPSSSGEALSTEEFDMSVLKLDGDLFANPSQVELDLELKKLKQELEGLDKKGSELDKKSKELDEDLKNAIGIRDNS